MVWRVWWYQGLRTIVRISWLNFSVTLLTHVQTQLIFIYETTFLSYADQLDPKQLSSYSMNEFCAIHKHSSHLCRKLKTNKIKPKEVCFW